MHKSSLPHSNRAVPCNERCSKNNWRKRVRVERTGDIRDAARRFWRSPGVFWLVMKIFCSTWFFNRLPGMAF